jgi:uncharacterized membrane protein YhaH (DUF805 family)
MLDTAFSFRGRIGRLRYFLSVLALIAVVGIPLALLIVMIGPHPGAGALGGLILVLLLALLALPVLVWSSLALQAKRFRDIGWDPVFVLPGLFLFALADALVALAAPALAIGPHQHETWVGAAVSLGSGCALLFWPGRQDDSDSPKTGFGWMTPSEPDAAPAPAPAAAILATPVLPRGPGQAATFGRRGV